MPERRLIGLHAAGPRVPRDAVLPAVCVPTMQGMHNMYKRTEESQRKTSSTSTIVNNEETMSDAVDIVHIYAENKQKNRHSTTTNEETANVLQGTTMGKVLQTNHTTKLTYQEHKRAYPWAHDASKKTFMKTDLADETEYINHKNIDKMLTKNMKKTTHHDCKVTKTNPSENRRKN